MRINDLPMIMLKCLLCTIVIEILIALLCGVRRRKDLLNVVLVNVLTNPIVVSLPVLLGVNLGVRWQIISLVILEVLTLIIEGLIYSKVLDYRKINPYVLSLILNLSSYLIGEVINRL